MVIAIDTQYITHTIVVDGVPLFNDVWSGSLV
jgi:hypothetical protein